MQLIYVSGPLTGGDQRENVRTAMAEAAKLRDAGRDYAVLVPHLNWFFEMAHPCPEELCLQMDFEVVKRCDIVLRIPGVSHGGDRETALAESLNIPVFYGTAEEFLSRTREQS